MACAHGAHLFIQRWPLNCVMSVPLSRSAVRRNRWMNFCTAAIILEAGVGGGRRDSPLLQAVRRPIYFWDPSIVGCCGGAGARCDDELCCACAWPEFLMVQSKLWSYV